jgi:hypothetical protein
MQFGARIIAPWSYDAAGTPRGTDFLTTSSAIVSRGAQ